MATVTKRKWTHNGVTKEAWIVRYIDPATGKRPGKTFKMKKDADKYRLKVEKEIESGLHIAAGDELTVKEVCERFIRHTEDRRRNGDIGKGRYAAIHQQVTTHVIPGLGRRKFNQLTALVVEEWLSKLRAPGGGATGRGLSAHVIRALVSLMKMIEDYALKHGITKKRVVNEARQGLGNLKGEPIRTFTIEELRQLVSGIETGVRGRSERGAHLLRCYVHIAAFCGLRLGEINGLKPEHVDLTRRVIRVRHNLTSYGELKGPKTKAGVRDVPMPGIVLAMITEWMTKYYKPNALGVVFTTGTGEPLYRIDFNTRWLRLLRLAGLRNGRSLHFHALRHFAASWMIENGLPLPDVARILGHEHFDMTLQVYAHPVRDVSHHLAAFDRMADTLALRPPPPAVEPVAALLAAE